MNRKGTKEILQGDQVEKKAEKYEVAEIDRMVNSDIGALIFMIGLILVTQVATYTCDKYKCQEDLFVDWVLNNYQNTNLIMRELFPLPSYRTFAIFLSFMSIQWLMHFFLPGKIGMGQPQFVDGVRLQYKYNAFLCYFITCVSLIAAVYFKYFDVNWVVGNYAEMAMAAQISSMFFSVLVYLKGVTYKEGSNPSGKVILDFFYGYDVNPRFFGAITCDVKFFAESRALIAWQVMDICIVFKQIADHGSVNTGLMLVVFFHTVYIAQSLFKESFLVTMLDFIGDNLGFMLTWGNMCWVQIIFCIPAMYVYKNTIDVPPVLIVLFIAINLSGFYIFYGTNSQKAQFRTDPTKPIWGKPPKVIPTKSGGGLLISGFWGLSRKMNYCGDLIVALSFSLPTMIVGVIPHLYFSYLFVLLLHRQMRDEHWCKGKYGAVWDQYCAAVPYKIFPYLY